MTELADRIKGVIDEEPVVLFAASAVEPDTEDGRVRSAGQLLDAPEGREQHVRLPSHRAGERVAARQRVVDGNVVETTPDGLSRGFSVGDQREQVVLGEPFAAAEERKLDHEVDPDDVAAELLDEARDRLHRSPRR